MTLTLLITHYHHCFSLYDRVNGVELNNHCQIHTLELPKWRGNDITEDIDCWAWLFKQGENLNIDKLPIGITKNPLMRQAVSIISRFSEKQLDYFRYQDRVNYARVRADEKYNLEEALELKREALEKVRLKDEALDQKQEALDQKNEALKLEREEKQEVLKEMQRLKEEILLLNS